MSKSKDSEASDTILTYLSKQNRPYSVIDIFNNLHKEIGKTQVIKALDQLVAKNKIREKVYGKQKVYFADQNQFPDLDNADLAKMDGEIASLALAISEKEQQIKKQEAELSSLNNSLTTGNLKTKLENIENDIATLKNKIAELQSCEAKPISPEEKEAIQKTYEKYNKEWKKRKRMATDVIDAVLENYPKNKKQFFEEVGLETDENN